ncbi:MAG TPA: enoyl-CoA hydratase/isomerase family protein [Patescibacteria group bacterium]|nr:enoyl-CoA hydratase/isomerase family protein [Patescibacteria group bacterium]
MRTIRLVVEGAVARVALDRPEVLNAGNAEWVRDLGEVVARIARAPDVRVVVLTGAGRAFSTGVDLDALASGSFGLADFVAWEDAMVAIERMDRLFVAGINGHCLGGGLQLALVCDYRLASDAARLGLPAVRECLIPSMALYRLPRLIGAARARALILLGEPIDARTAERYGLVNRAVAAADFERELDATVQKFLALPPASVRASKVLTARAFDLEFDAFRREMEAHFKVCLASDEHRAAMQVIRERRRGSSDRKNSRGSSARPSGAGALRRHPDGKSK